MDDDTDDLDAFIAEESERDPEFADAYVAAQGAQDDETPQEVPDGAGRPENEPQAVSVDSVPDHADAVAAWVEEAEGSDRLQRAVAAKAAEMERAPSQRRKTVLALVNAMLNLPEDDGLPD